MNKWECEHPGCRRSVVGCGGAIGLRAIGWYFVYAGPIFCPEHRPDKNPICRDNSLNKDPCALCRADEEAERWQTFMRAAMQAAGHQV